MFRNRSTSAASLLSATCTAVGLALALGLLARAAHATQSFAYEWRSPRVHVTWQEGNDTPTMSAARRQVGHWKRLAQTLWAEKPGAPALEMKVRLYGPELGGAEAPHVTLRAGSRSQTVSEPITDEKVEQALVQVRDGTAPGRPVVPADDSLARLSPNGQWIATVSWRGSGPEVWLARRDARIVFRVPYRAEAPLRERLILTEPHWAPDGRSVAWIQGGRVVLLELARRSARLITPAGKDAVEIDWSPATGGPLLVRFSEDTFHLMDIGRGHRIPLSDLLHAAAPTGRIFWAPSGKKLLFRTQGRIVSASLSGPQGALVALERMLGRAVGTPAPPEPESGAAEERLAVLDLPGRRIDGYSVRETPLESAPIHSVGWSPDEDVVYTVLRGYEDEPAQLLRMPLRHEGRPVALLKSTEPLAALGWRSPHRGADEAQRAATGAVFAHGARLLVVPEGESAEVSHPYPATEFVALRVQPGPEGGYQGVEEEEITSTEPGMHVVLESALHTGELKVKRRFPGGFLVAIPLDTDLVQRLRQTIGEGAVDLDVHPEASKLLAMVVKSEDGGVGELVALRASNPRAPLVAPFSELMTQRPADVLELSDDPYRLMDVETGIAGLPLPQRSGPWSLVWMIAAGIAALLGVLLLLQRLRRR